MVEGSRQSFDLVMFENIYHHLLAFVDSLTDLKIYRFKVDHHSTT
jgi:hypothetical protein